MVTKMETKKISEIGVVAALYAVLVIALGPISYAQLQFRVAEMLKPLVIPKKHLILGIALGNFVGNIFSPFGYLELTLMPITCIVWGYVCHVVGTMKYTYAPYVGSIVYAFGTSLSVAAMLSYVLPIPFFATLLSVMITETVLLIVGTVLMQKLTPFVRGK